MMAKVLRVVVLPSLLVGVTSAFVLRTVPPLRRCRASPSRSAAAAKQQQQLTLACAPSKEKRDTDDSSSSLHPQQRRHSAPFVSRRGALSTHGAAVSSVGAALFVATSGASPARGAPMIDTRKRASPLRSEEYEDETPSYLSEPTEEFKRAEAERAAFRKRQAEYRQTWDAGFAAFQAAADSDDAMVAALAKLTKLVLANGGLPSGLRLADMITLCRRVKAKASQLGGWSTPVEIEYMNLVSSVKKVQNPNMSVDESGYL